MRLLDPKELERSSIVAHRAMNRERRLAGRYGYEGELHLDLLEHLRVRSRRSQAAWTDWCCGTGRALVEAAVALAAGGESHRVRIEGVDLAGLFDANPHPEILALREQAIEAWQPDGPCALITCVHGLHYVGDKLSALAKAAASLAPDGLFVANLDLANIRHADGSSAARAAAAWLREQGFTWDSRRRLVRREGRLANVRLPRYLGADDTAGPNCTGELSVASHYEL